MTPPPKHMRHERTLPILEAPSFSFLLSQPLLTDIRGMIPMIHVANPRTSMETIFEARSKSTAILICLSGKSIFHTVAQTK